MLIDKDNYPLVDYIKQLSDQNHLMMLYDDKEYAQIVQNQFIIEGLKNNEKCVVFTHGNSELVKKTMREGGIDVEEYTKDNLLFICPLDTIVNDPLGIVVAFDEFYKKIMDDSKQPCRFVGRFISDVCTRKGIEQELLLEKTFHDNFNSYNCSFMCPYGIEDIESDHRNNWIKKLSDHHHKLVYATSPESAVGFDTDLINTVQF